MERPNDGMKPGSIARQRDWRDALARRRYDDPAKELVMARVAELVRGGFAEWRLLDDQDIELRFVSGEVFLLSDETVTRVA